MVDQSAWMVDTRPRREGCSVTDLLAAVNQLHERHSTARLIRNQVGNLSALVVDQCVGFLDLTFGRFVDHADLS